MQRKSKLKDKETTLVKTDRNANFSGRVWLGWPNQIGLADEVLNTDPAISTGWLGLLSVMGQATIDIAGDGTPAPILDFLRTMLFKKLDRRFNAVFLDVLQALVYGCQPLEVCTRYERGQWWLTDLVPIPARQFELETLQRQPGQWWIEGRCFTADGRVIECGGPDSGKALVLWVTYGPGLLGKSIIRPILAEHEQKSQIRRLREIGLSKSVLGTIAAFERKPDLNAGEVSYTDQELNDQAEAIADATEAAEKSVIVLPNRIDKVQPVYPAADAVTKTTEAEDHVDLQILQAFGSQHLARGLLSSYGSQGAAESDSKAQQALRGYYFQWAASALQPLIDWICEINYPRIYSYPELSIISPAPQSPESLIRSYVQLVSIGAITPGEADSQLLRRLLRLPANPGKPLQTEAQGVKPGARVPGSYDKTTGIDTRDRTNEYRELKGE